MTFLTGLCLGFALGVVYMLLWQWIAHKVLNSPTVAQERK